MTGVMMAALNNVASATTPPVTSGLELYYDPSNSSSYPGSGTTLFDLSLNAANATLVGSPTDAGNWFTFAGSQAIQTPDMSGLISGWQHSLEIWVRPSIVCCAFSDCGSSSYTSAGYHATGLEFYNVGPSVINNAMLWNSGTGVTRVGGAVTPLNNWYQVVRVYNGTNTAYAYVNKVKSADTSITWTTPSPGWFLSFGSSDGTKFATGVAFQGSIGVIRLYNKVLTLAEVTQNYNADKAKYGL